MHALQVYPEAVGANVPEIERLHACCALTFKQPFGTRHNYLQGEDMFLDPDLNEEQAETACPRGFAEIRPWFRLVPPAAEDE